MITQSLMPCLGLHSKPQSQPSLVRIKGDGEGILERSVIWLSLVGAMTHSGTRTPTQTEVVSTPKHPTRPSHPRRDSSSRGRPSTPPPSPRLVVLTIAEDVHRRLAAALDQRPERSASCLQAVETPAPRPTLNDPMGRGEAGEGDLREEEESSREDFSFV